MMLSLFGAGFKGLSDTKWAGLPGSVHRSVGIDYRSKPGIITVHQKLTKQSASVVTELCKACVPASDGSNLWFSSESGKVWRESGGTYTQKLDLALVAKDILASAQKRLTIFSSSAATRSSVVRLSDDGSDLFTLNYLHGEMRHFRLSTPFNTSTAQLSTDTLAVDSAARSFFWGENGKKLFVLLKQSVELRKANPWTLGSATTAHHTWDLSAQVTDAQDCWFKSDGTVLFVLDANGTIYEYSLERAWGPDVDNFWVVAQGGGGAGAGVSNNATSFASIDMYSAHAGGGGGAGRLIDDPNTALAAQPYTITIGAGGTGASGDTQGADGSDTTAFGKTAKGGGGGGIQNKSESGTSFVSGRPGGSGGGGGGGGNGSFGGTSVANGGTNDSGSGGYGFNGGAGKTTSNPYGGGGGGGAGSAGSDGTTNQDGGAGGNGKNVYITGVAVPLGGGGGGGGSTGGTAGSSIGGAGGSNGGLGIPSSAAGANASANTGSGGGGGVTSEQSGGAVAGGNGAAGTAIIRFKTAAVSYSNGSGSVSTVGADTVIRWNTNGTFDFDWVDDGITLADTHNFPVSHGLFIDADRLLLARDETIALYNLGTDWDLDTAVAGNILPTDNAPKSLWEGNNMLFVGLFSGEEDGSVETREYADTELKILDAKEFAPLQSEEAVSKYVHDTRTAPIDGNIVFGLSSGSARALRVAQQITLAEDATIDRATFVLRENVGINGKYDLVFKIAKGAPDATPILTDTQTVAPDDIVSSSDADTYSEYTFAFSATALEANVPYYFVIEVAPTGWDTIDKHILLPYATKTGYDGIKVYRSAWSDPLDANIESTVMLPMSLWNSSTVEAEAETEPEPRVYFSVENLLYYIKVADIAGSWAGKVYVAGKFEKGHATHHPMMPQNLELFIGDGSVVASVDEVGAFTAETALNLPTSETVQALVPFDTDLLIGTSDIAGFGRALRWDTTSESWSAQDEVFEEGGVTAFVRDDNFVYVAVGKHGRIYFYNGEKMEAYQQIPGDWSASQQGIIHLNASGFFMKNPIFGLSDLTGNPQLQGVYGIGAYNRGYDKTVSLDFPISTGTFDSVSIGAILVRGADLWVAWKTASAVGVDKIDYTAKNANAYFETRVISDVANDDGSKGNARHLRKTLKNVSLPYASLPANTGITVSYKKKNEASFTALETAKDDADRQKLYHAQTVPNVGSLQLRATFTVATNAAPELEDMLVDLISAE